MKNLSKACLLLLLLGQKSSIAKTDPNKFRTSWKRRPIGWNRRSKADDSFHEIDLDSKSSSAITYSSSSQEERDNPAITSIPASIISSLAISFTRHVTPERVLRVTFTGVQLGIVIYLVKTIWAAVGDVLDELDQESSSSSRFKEDHDLPFVQEDWVNYLDSKNTTNGSPVHNKKRSYSSNKDTTAITSTTNLAMRLHAAGIPFDNTHTSKNSATVQTILKSLTRTEGQLLSNTLLSPMDFQDSGIIHSQPTMKQRTDDIMKKWEDIGGLDDIKESLLDLVFPMLMLQQETHGEGRNYYGGLLNNPPGVLLYGPPGCGKTMLVRALAYTANARFLYVSPSTLLRKYVGETNLYVRALFSLARKISPCIIFIDEMEGLFRERSGTLSSGGDEHEVSRELKTEFMQLWDGILSGDRNQHVLIVGATNRPFDVDSAFLRRMPRSFYVGLPDASSRLKILRSILSNVPLTKDFDMERLARETEQYSPSDIKEMLRTAALYPLREARTAMVCNTSSSSNTTKHIIPPLRPLSMDDVMKAMEKVQPTQFSAPYRSALSDYARKACGGRKYEDLVSQTDASQAMLQPFADSSIFTHLSSSEINTEEENNNLLSDQEEEDSYSSSLDDDDDD